MSVCFAEDKPLVHEDVVLLSEMSESVERMPNTYYLHTDTLVGGAAGDGSEVLGPSDHPTCDIWCRHSHGAVTGRVGSGRTFRTGTPGARTGAKAKAKKKPCLDTGRPANEARVRQS